MEQAQLLQKAFSFADTMKVYKNECCDLVASAIQFNDQLTCDEEWYNQLLDINDSLLAWHQLNPLSSFLQSEEIADMLSYYRERLARLAEKCATSSDSIQPSHAPMDISSVLPVLSGILHDAEAVRTLNELSNSEANKAMVLLRQCLDAMPISSPDSLATQAILGNLQPLNTPPSRHGSLSESQELAHLCDGIIDSTEPTRRPLSRQPSAAQSIESAVADPTLPSMLRTETLPPIDEERSHPSVPPGSPRLSNFSWEQPSSKPDCRRLLSFSECECFKYSSTGQHRPWCSQTMTPYPPLITTPPVPRADPRTSLPTTVSEVSSPPLSIRSLTSTSRPLPAVPVPGRPPVSYRYTPNDLPQVIVDSPISTTTVTPTNILSPPINTSPTPTTSLQPLGSDSLDAVICTVAPAEPTIKQAVVEKGQPLLIPSPINTPPDDDPDADSRGPSPIVATPPIDFSTCRARLQVLVEEEEKFIQDNWEVKFAASLRNANPPLVPLGLVDNLISSTFGTFLQIRAAHSLALAAVRPLTESFNDLGSLETLFILTRDIMARFSSLYPEYAQGLNNLHTVVEDAIEVHQSFRVWMEAEAHQDRLCTFLRRPFERLEGYLSTLREVVEFIEGESGNRYTYGIRTRLREWESLIFQTRLWGWQSSMGHDPLFDREFEELTNISDGPIGRNSIRLARQRAKFKVVELQMFFVDMLKGLSKGVWTWLSTASNPPSEKFTGLLDALNILLRHHTALLGEFHGQQRLRHPQMTRLLNTLDQLSGSWSSPYHQYCQILTECQSEIHSFRLDDLVFLPDTTHPRLHGKDLLTLLRAPMLHLRHLNRALRSLMDVTPDDHLEMRCLVDVLSTLSMLADQCQNYHCWTGVNLHLQELIMQLVWTEADVRDFGVEQSWRKLVETGWLLLPRTVSTTHGPGGDEMGPHGTSEYSELLDVFVVILDNCVLVSKVISRWGVRRFVVLKAIRLNQLEVVDPALSDPSSGRLYLLDDFEGKRVAAPLEIRDESKGETLILYAPTTAVATSWREWLLSAKLAPNMLIRQSSRLFRTKKIADLDSHPQCSTIISVKGKRYLLFGGGFGQPMGVWMITQDEPSTLVIAGSILKQCAVIESLGVILMLLGKGPHYNLYAYKLEDLVSPGQQNLDQLRDTIRCNVTFFRVGYHQSQPFLVIITEATRATQVHWYIPPTQAIASWRRNLFTKDGGTLFQKVGKYETNVRVWDVDILPNDEGLVLMGESGFQLIKMDKSNRFEITGLPQLPDHASSHVAQRCRTTKPIGIVKIDSEFLLCYSDFGIYTTPQGRIYGRAVDWETSQRMTHVSFLPPYFLLVSATSIEIRVIKDGRHVQTIEGKNIRLIRAIGEVRGSSHSEKKHEPGARREDVQRMHVVLEDPPDERSKVELLELEIPVLDVSSP